MTRRYDDLLRPFGVSVVQFSVMTTVRNVKETPVSEMAGRIAMDRTTLLRNLDLLVRKGLVADSPVNKGHGRAFKLTLEGDKLLDQLIPKWREAQDEIRTLLGNQDSEEFLHSLRLLTRG